MCENQSPWGNRSLQLEAANKEAAVEVMAMFSCSAQTYFQRCTFNHLKYPSRVCVCAHRCTSTIMPDFIWVLKIQTQVFILMQLAIFPLSHFLTLDFSIESLAYLLSLLVLKPSTPEDGGPLLPTVL